MGGRAKGWLCHHTKREGKRNNMCQRAHFLDQTVKSSYLKVIHHGYLCIKNRINKSGLSAKWQLLVQVLEDKLRAFQKLVPNVLLPNGECSFMAAGPRSQGMRYGGVGAWGHVPLLTSCSPTSCAQRAGQAIVSMHRRSNKWAKGKLQSTKNACSLPCPKCRRRLRGNSAVQLQGVYSKLSHHPSSVSSGIQAPTSKEGT